MADIIIYEQVDPYNIVFLLTKKYKCQKCFTSYLLISIVLTIHFNLLDVLSLVVGKKFLGIV